MKAQRNKQKKYLQKTSCSTLRSPLKPSCYAQSNNLKWLLMLNLMTQGK